MTATASTLTLREAERLYLLRRAGRTASTLDRLGGDDRRGDGATVQQRQAAQSPCVPKRNNDGGAQPLMALLILLAFYFLPAFIALLRGKRNAGALAVLNLLLGWTLVGWVVALVWALTNDAQTPPPATYVPPAPAPRIDALRARNHAYRQRVRAARRGGPISD